MNNVYLLSVTIQSRVRQSIQFKMEDLKLPDQTIETLEHHGAVSVRPNLSNKLKAYLGQLRSLQGELYAEHCISHGQSHFLLDTEFRKAMVLVERMQTMATACNEELGGSWYSELKNWDQMVAKTIEPLFKNDPDQLDMVTQAYRGIFPSKEEFANALEVEVVGPYPASLEVADNPGETLREQIAQTAAINTSNVYKAAQQGALDRAYKRCAELVDDLDTRYEKNIGLRQVGGSSDRRGAWQVAAEELSLISDHVPGLSNTKQLAQAILDAGRRMVDTKRPAQERSEAFKTFNNFRAALKVELQNVIKNSQSTEGLEHLQRSLSLSNKYQDILSSIRRATTPEELEEYEREAETEAAIYNHRSQALKKELAKRLEFFEASRVSVADEVKETEELIVETEEDCDF